MTLKLSDFGKFKIVQDDGNWIDRDRIVPVINYWKHYFDHMFVSGTVIHKAGDKPDVQYDVTPKRVVIKGHTCINSLAIMFACLERNHTVIFDNSTNLTEDWYKKVKPDVLIVGTDDLILPGSRYTSGPNSVRLLFTRKMTNMFEYDKEFEIDPKSVWIEHKDKRTTKFTREKLLKQFDKFENSPAVAFVEQDSRHQVKQLIECLLPLMYKGAKIVLDTGLEGFDWKQSMVEHRPDLCWWGVKLEKAIKDYDPWLNTLSPTPLYIPHIRKTKVTETNSLPDFIKEPDSETA
jgi:hypothetical protein